MFAVLLGAVAVHAAAEDGKRRSETVTSVLRKPLPPEDVRCLVDAGKITIQGPTYRYVVDRATGAISSLRVEREGRTVVRLKDSANIIIDDWRLAAKENSGKTSVVTRGSEKVVLKTTGLLKAGGDGCSDLGYRLTHVFYNDGVVVSKLTLLPQEDLLIREGIRHCLTTKGPFSHHLHKRLDHHGASSPYGPLPQAGKAVRFKPLTSCLQVFSPEAAVAIFTDSGGIHLAKKGLDTAVVEVKETNAGQALVSLTQHVISIGSGGKPYLLKAGAAFTFRVGISIAPNRLPHPRRRDLRMFIWAGDKKHPYPSDTEIEHVAQLGFTLFQMHRLGTPGVPRPPAGELERVIKTVHRTGMLFLWTANADLMYASAKSVSDLRASGKWSLWQGFNYGGRYTASMDPYCDLVATCLASPNGLADYRVACIGRMMDTYQVDGMYIDDNLAYGNCTLRKEHGHPRSPYDSLIELHEMNWRRRQALREACPHAVLVDHCSAGLVLPVICDFDVHLYGEGYGFSTLRAYWDLFGSIGNMYAQGSMYPGDTEGSRCAANVAYNYDLLTGGGQFTYLDWRLYPKKFPYAKGVTEDEPLFIRTYNLPQYYFGMYESDAFCFAVSADVFSATTPNTYATVYRNRVWKDYLIPIANMGKTEQETAVQIHSARKLELSADADYVLYDVNERTKKVVGGRALVKGLGKIRVPGRGLRLLYLRERPGGVPYHLWGGKRISEAWDASGQTLSVEVHGPTGLRDVVFIGVGDQDVREVKVGGKRAAFAFDPSRRIAHGRVRFGPEPIRIQVMCSKSLATKLPEQAITANELVTGYYQKR